MNESFSELNLNSLKTCNDNSFYSIDLNKNQLKSETNDEFNLTKISIENDLRL